LAERHAGQFAIIFGIALALLGAHAIFALVIA
jgi:hypothetical protein